MCHALIVEDEVDVRDLFAMLLARNGFECTCATDAEEARALLLVQRPDVAVVDINLPGQSGVEFCWNLHRKDPEIPVVIVSAVLQQWDPADIRDCGAQVVLDKAQPVKDIIATIAAVARTEGQE
jgi:DNA-binding response OmpR family regulator